MESTPDTTNHVFCDFEPMLCPAMRYPAGIPEALAKWLPSAGLLPAYPRPSLFRPCRTRLAMELSSKCSHRHQPFIHLTCKTRSHRSLLVCDAHPCRPCMSWRQPHSIYTRYDFRHIQTQSPLAPRTFRAVGNHYKLGSTDRRRVR